MADTNDILNQVKKLWNNLGAGQKVAAGGVTLLVFAGILAAAIFGGNPDYKQLIGQVAPKDLSGILSQLEDVGISDYKIIAGTAIHVKSGDYELGSKTLYMSGTLPSKGVDEDTSSFLPSTTGLSSEERTHTRMRGAEKRLQKTLRGLGFIERATITITAKKRRYFRGGKEAAKASVIVKSRGVLSKSQIETIAHVVSSGVPSLSADAVHISNTMGMVLKKPSPDGETRGQEARLAYKAQLEQNKTMKAQETLDLVYGPNKVLVALDVNLDWTRSNVIQKKFDTEGKVVKEKKTTESSKPAGASNSGGPVSNTATANGGKKEKSAVYKDSTKMETADYGFTESKVVTLGGSITRMTASVFVDESLSDSKDELLQTVATAIGLDESRGDKIQIMMAKMAAPTEIDNDSDVEAVATNEKIQFYIEKGIYLIIGLVFVFFALRTVKKAQADLRNVLEASLEEEKKEDPVAPLTLEESVLESAVGDTDLAGRSLRRWLYEGAEVAE